MIPFKIFLLAKVKMHQVLPSLSFFPISVYLSPSTDSPESLHTTAKVSIEAGVTLDWHKYIEREGEVIGINHLGASAPGKKLLQKFGLTSENILNRVRTLLDRKKGGRKR